MGSSLLWSKWAVWLWVVILCCLGGYEFWDLLSGDLHTPPLTRVTVKFVPWWITLPFIAWLFYHFAVRYFSANYVSGLK